MYKKKKHDYNSRTKSKLLFHFSNNKNKNHSQEPSEQASYIQPPPSEILSDPSNFTTPVTTPAIVRVNPLRYLKQPALFSIYPFVEITL